MSGTMNAYEASMFLQAQACLVRVEAMKAENESRKLRGVSPAYGEDAFEATAKSIDWYASVLQS